ncbi:ribulokinase [Bacillus sp. 1P06AnD]|uniref:ribulokinase n=1 Tax=Bacillus sp. 1P06AnD TaxID=3132208 RepID=UPI0039A3051E
MDRKYTIGVDFGTESARALLVDVITGQEVAFSVASFEHGVMDKRLQNGIKLGNEWALQDPQDYLDALCLSITALGRKAKIDMDKIIGIGIDFTSSTILPLDQSGNPLCFQPEYRENPHSWVKLWKHHSSQAEATFMTKIAEKRNEPFLRQYGGKISSEWMFPKILEILKDAPEIFLATDIFMEAGDWLTYKLTGNLIRSANSSGFKALWSKKEGYPSNLYFKSLDPLLGNIIDTKMRGKIMDIGSEAGLLSDEMAVKLNLPPGISVAVACIDAHAGVPAVGSVDEGQLVMTMGTSTCHMVLSKREVDIQGICGMVEDGIVPGYYSYETGQAAVGDLFNWFVERITPLEIKDEAEKKGQSIHSILEEKVAHYAPGETGLVALDWWNGNRSVLVDADLSGMIIGLTLDSKPLEIFRALLESTAYGTRRIIEAFIKSGIEIKEIVASGGIPQRNQTLMQMYADITQKEIKIGGSEQPMALGSAIYAAVAAGTGKGGYGSLEEASKQMSSISVQRFVPNPNYVPVYDQIYKVYLKLHDYFGINQKDVMHTLKKLKGITNHNMLF